MARKLPFGAEKQIQLTIGWRWNTITTDSNYLKDGITQWLDGRKKKDWKTASKKPVKNKDLWIKLDELSNFHNVKWKWVKGHSGHRENDIADLLANKGIDEL